MAQSTTDEIQNNRLSVELKAFNHALKIFKVGIERKNAKKPPVILPAMLSFNDGFLSIECDERVAVMNATGEWHGKVQFSHSIVKALALVPISANPVIITYVDGKITIGSTTTTCIWVSSSQGMIDKISNPSMIDIFAMWQTQPADQLLTKGVKQSNKLAKDKLLKTTASVAKKLEAFEVTQDDLLNLIESKVKARILKHINSL